MKSQDLFEIIKSRRAVTPPMYSQENISQEELNLILESANWAPNHRRTEPWRFIVLEKEALDRFGKFMLEKYKEATPEEERSERKMKGIIDKCLNSNKIILINVKTSGLVPEWEELAATAMAVQNMWLMCTSMNIGSYWSSPSTIAKMHEFVELEENESCYGIFYMGKMKAELFDGSRKPIEDKVKVINA